MSNLVKMNTAEIQKAALETLVQFDSICRKIDAKYFVNFGSLIGVIRHHGFIPWDDDLDVSMLREDYDKFTEYFLKHRSEYPGFSLDNKETVKNIPFAISRFCNLNYVYIFDKFSDYHTSGAFIDIYPYDALGTDKDLIYWKKISRERMFLNKCIYSAGTRSLWNGSSLLKKILNVPISIYSKTKGSRYFIEKQEKLVKRFKLSDSRYVYSIVWCEVKDNPYFEKDLFENLTYKQFENIQVPVPIEYDRYLRALYGDYMKLPPKDQRHPYHGYQAYKVSG